MSRPAGLSPGAAALAGAWLAALVIALLTGATAVVVVLAAGAVGGTGAAFTGWWALRGSRVEEVAGPSLMVAGEEQRWRVTGTARRGAWVEVRIGGVVVAEGPLCSGTLGGTTPPRGHHERAEVRWSSAGGGGLVWWRRRAAVALSPVWVAPPITAARAPVERHTDTVQAGLLAVARPGREQPDGVRPWREGDEVHALHWPSTLRSGELVVRSHVGDADERWTVTASPGTADPDAEAARVRGALDDGLAAGARVLVCVGAQPPEPILDRDEAARWTAAFDAPPRRRTRWRRTGSCEPVSELTARARWAVAAAGAVALLMVLEPLGYGLAHMATVVAATVIGVVVSRRTHRLHAVTRSLVALSVSALVAVALIDVGRITSVAASLRFLLPQLLVALVVLQGFECSDRRRARVSLACTCVLVAYAAGVRIDPMLGAWLLAAAFTVAWAVSAVGSADQSLALRGDRSLTLRATGGRATARVVRAVALTVAAAVAIVAVLTAVPVPRGPAQLTLPSWLESRRPAGARGELAAPDGSPLFGGASSGTGDGSRGVSGSYMGFSPAMDIAARGDLGDEVVLRVRAPQPDFWRGQTFTTFDGRVWTVAEEDGSFSAGPDHAVEPAAGDAAGSGDEFVQTFYAETDLPNLIYAATSVRRVLLDAGLYQRRDGALRADVVLPAGSAYTVLSERSRPTAALLRERGDVAGMLSGSEYLQVPASTTSRVRDLAAQLAADAPTTYDVVMAIEEWLGGHVAYDLDAPVPPPGADAVDHFLFESHLGYCEQIASATAVMLRTLGIAARVATGYVPSDRDRVAGLWISRARDAHAWVEVLFPDFGWVPFDPTASVPLSGEAADVSVGSEVARALATWFGDHVVAVLVAVVAAAGSAIAVRTVVVAVRRRRRGRWGVLQDRFTDLAVRRGAAPSATNRELAASFAEQASLAGTLADALDASAFAPVRPDDDASFERARALGRELASSAGVRRRSGW